MDFSRHDDPYVGVSREPGLENLWFGEVPRTRHPPDGAVACSYWIYAKRHTVTCNSIATLTLPY